jgi:excisionase family DNA binding protein
MQQKPELNDYGATATRLAVSRTTVERLVRRGDLRAVRIGRRVLVSDVEIARFIAEREQTPNAA